MAQGDFETMEKDIQQFLEKNPVAVGIGLAAVGLLILTTPGKQRTDIPGLGGRRNAAWRGKGSLGSAPFGSQMGHRR